MKKRIYTGLLLALWGMLTVAAWFSPTREVSDAERRKLAQMPQLTTETLLSGRFASDFESYTLDQFPLRDSFRQIKALTHYYCLGQKDKDGIYLHHGYAAQQVYPLNETSLEYAMGRFQWVQETYLSGSRIFFAVVPDKHYYLAADAGQPSLDYQELFHQVETLSPWATHISLADVLTMEDYYKTDTHWRQERLLPVAEKIALAMGNPAPNAEDYTALSLGRPFYGVYYGQAALPMAPDTLTLLQSEALDSCQVFDFETGKVGSVYDMTKLDSRDLYDVYLSGARALLTIENPSGTPGEELLIFRDSFGSSLAPLLLGDYSKVTLIDLRYIAPGLLENFLEFTGQDVLFLYSTLVLNDSSSLK